MVTRGELVWNIIACSEVEKLSSLTFPASVRLNELIFGTSLLEFRGQPSQLRKDFVDESHFRGQVIFMYV